MEMKDIWLISKNASGCKPLSKNVSSVRQKWTVALDERYLLNEKFRLVNKHSNEVSTCCHGVNLKYPERLVFWNLVKFVALFWNRQVQVAGIRALKVMPSSDSDLSLLPDLPRCGQPPVHALIAINRIFYAMPSPPGSTEDLRPEEAQATAMPQLSGRPITRYLTSWKQECSSGRVLA